MLALHREGATPFGPVEGASTGPRASPDLLAPTQVPLDAVRLRQVLAGIDLLLEPGDVE